MPHINIEFTSNIAKEIDPQRLVDVIHEAALELGTFPLPGLKTRATPCEFYRSAEGDPENGFVHIRVRMSAGTPADAKRKAAEVLLDKAATYLGHAFASRPMSITVEVLELAREFHLRKNNIEERYKAQRQS